MIARRLALACAFVLTGLALAGVVACNAVTGINDYSTPSCDECQRRECAAAFSACRADVRCTNATLCVQNCPSTAPGDPTCPDRCLAGPDGGAPPTGASPPPPDPDGGAAPALMACAQTRCPVCSPQ